MNPKICKEKFWFEGKYEVALGSNCFQSLVRYYAFICTFICFEDLR